MKNVLTQQRKKSPVLYLGLSVFLLISCALIFPGIARATGQNGPAEWPTKAPYDDAICAFDKALTQASRDKEFRQRLTESCDSAKKAVAEIGNIAIPDDRVIIFYEGEAAEIRKRKVAKFKGSRSSEKIHVFVLPDWNDKGPHRYEEYFVGMYEYWLRKNAPCELPKP